MPKRNEAEAHRKAWDTRGRAQQSETDVRQTSGDFGLEKPEFEETRDLKRFIAARDSHPLSAFMSPVTEEDLREKRVFLSKDGKTGYTLDKDGDFGNLFNLPGGEKGRASRAIVEGIRNGAKTLDCFDGVLPNLYFQHGFVPVARLKFDPSQAPAGWDEGRFGRPDVVFMRYTGGARRKIHERVGSFGKVSLDGTRYVDDYGAGQAASRAEASD